MHGSMRDRLEAQRALMRVARYGKKLLAWARRATRSSFCAACLEELLSAGSPGVKHVSERHLAQCAECTSEFESMKQQVSLLQSLRVPEVVEPAAGFYARVLQRIEERAKESIWAGVIYSPFSKRLAYASLTLALALSSYVIASEASDGHLIYSEQVSAAESYMVPVMGNQAQQRDAVLVNFVYSKGSSQ